MLGTQSIGRYICLLSLLHACQCLEPFPPVPARAKAGVGLLGPVIEPSTDIVKYGDTKLSLNLPLIATGIRHHMLAKERYEAYGGDKPEFQFPLSPDTIKKLMPFGSKNTDPIAEQALANNQIIAGMGGVKGLRGASLARTARVMSNPVGGMMSSQKPIQPAEMERLKADRAKQRGEPVTGSKASKQVEDAFSKLPELERKALITKFWNNHTEQTHSTPEMFQMQNFLKFQMDATTATQGPGQGQRDLGNKHIQSNPLLNMIGVETADAQTSGADTDKDHPDATQAKQKEKKYGDVTDRTDQIEVGL